MPRNRYIGLIQGLGHGLGLQDSHAIVLGAPLEIDDVLFSLVYGDRTDPNGLFVYCDFGEMPQGMETEVCLTLLNLNFVMYTGKGPSFTVSPDTGRVILAKHYSLESLEPKTLRDKLIKLSSTAREWRAHHFLMPAAASFLEGLRRDSDAF